MEDTSASIGIDMYNLPSLSHDIQREDEIERICRSSNGESYCISLIQSQYPSANTLHEIARQAIGADDRDTIRRLAQIKSYLPIRWNAFISEASQPILNIISHMISLPPADIIDKDDIRWKIRDMLLDRVTPILSQSNYVLALGYALEYGRTDIIDIIINQFSERSTSNLYSRDEDLDVDPSIALLSLSTKYTDALTDLTTLPRNTMQYLVSLGYIDVTPMQRAIIMNDIAYLTENPDRIHIPSSRDIILILHYDALDIWKIYESEISLQLMIPILHDAKPSIARHILLTLTDDISSQSNIIIQILLTKIAPSDIYDILDLYEDSSFIPMKIQMLSLAAAQGYIEILDRYLTSSLILRVFASSMVYPSSKDNLTNMASLLIFKYRDTPLNMIGYYLYCMWMNYPCDIPRDVWYGYMRHAVIAGNIPLIQQIYSKYKISPEESERLDLIARQAHPIDITLYRVILRYIM